MACAKRYLSAPVTDPSVWARSEYGTGCNLRGAYQYCASRGTRGGAVSELSRLFVQVRTVGQWMLARGQVR